MTNTSGTERQQEPFPVSGPVDILAFIPHTLGFAPQESLVLMTMDNSRLGATLRLDLPGDALNYSEFAVRVTDLLRTDGTANGVLMALYTDREWKNPDAPPWYRLVAQLSRKLTEAGLPIRDGWLVSGHAWREYFCTDSGCCPWPGHSLGSIADSTLNAEMVYRGSAYARSLTEAVGLDLPPAWLSGREAERHRAAYGRRLRGRWCRRSQFASTLAVWESFMAGAAVSDTAGAAVPDPAGTSAAGTSTAGPSTAAGPSRFVGPASGAGLAAPGRGCPQLRSNPEAAGFLLASLQASPVRDTLLVMAALGGARALAGAAASHLLTADDRGPVLPPGRSGSMARPVPGPARNGYGPAPSPAPSPAPASDPGQDFREVLIGQYPGVPDWAGMDAAFAVFAELLAATTVEGPAGTDTGRGTSTSVEGGGEAAAALLSLLAWIEWARGRGSRAQAYLSRCLETYPGYRLAELLGELLSTGMFPVWARKAGTAWRPSPERHPGAARS